MPAGLLFIGAQYDVIYKQSSAKVLGRKPGCGKNDHGKSRAGLIVGPIYLNNPGRYGMKNKH